MLGTARSGKSRHFGRFNVLLLYRSVLTDPLRSVDNRKTLISD
ncbi:hypothetical protein BN903_186 [Halorubrum sp. AJ67]|nr:hypothetical protein BN903_186 [Halorubrum sp. AJ67]